MSKLDAADGEEDVGYGVYCETYGDCEYCEISQWFREIGCILVCYEWSCYDGQDSGGYCYWDCSYYA